MPQYCRWLVIGRIEGIFFIKNAAKLENNAIK